MLYDRCILTKRNDEWIGLVEVCQRIGERWRFVAWLMAIIVAFELFRLALAGFWYFNRWEFVILGLALFFAIACFRRSSKTFRQREEVFRHPNPFTTTSGKLSAIANKSSSPKRAITSPTTSTDSLTSSSVSSIILGLDAKTSPSKPSPSTSPNATEHRTPSSKALSINTPALPSLENYPLSQKFPSSNSEKDNLSPGKCPFHTKNPPHFLTPCEAKPMSHHRHPRNIDLGASQRRAAIWRGIGECTTSTRLSRDHG